MTRLTASASVDAIAQNLREQRNAATSENVREGRAWYPATGKLVSALADESGHSREIVAAVIAAYSQNATWKANLTMVRRCFFGDDPEIVGLPAVREEVTRILFDAEYASYPFDAIGGHRWDKLGLKRRDFARNIVGRHTYVTCDRWHLRAAFGSDSVKLTAEVRENVTRATRMVARENGESASACQAVIWCAIRGDGK